MQILVRDLRALAALTVNTTHMYSPATCLHLFIHIYVLSCLLLTFSVLSDTPLDQLTVGSVPNCLSLSTYILFLRPYSIQAARLQVFFSVLTKVMMWTKTITKKHCVRCAGGQGHAKVTFNAKQIYGR